MFALIKRFIRDRSGHDTLFSTSLAPAKYMAEALHGLSTHFEKAVPLFQGHALRRGTVSVLKRIGVPIEHINLHVGWAVHSRMFSTYHRFVQVHEVDKLFFADISA